MQDTTRRRLGAATAGAIIAGLATVATLLSGGSACDTGPAQSTPLPGVEWTGQPADAVATAPRCADWADRIYRYSSTAGPLNDALQASFGLDDPQYDYSIPIYHATATTAKRRVFPRPGWPGSFKATRGARIPWDASWRPAGGSDGHAVVIDDATGIEYDLWGLSTPQATTATRPQAGCLANLSNLLAGYSPSSDLCAATLAVVPPAPPGQERTTPAFPVGPLSLGVVTPDQIDAGRIDGPIGLIVSNQLSMTGPACSTSIVDPGAAPVGETCGLAASPAGQHESRAIRSTSSQLERMVPDGTRVAVKFTDGDIDRIIAEKAATGDLARLYRVVLTAMRDHGLIVGIHTSKSGATLTFAGDPASQARWRAMGVTGTGRDVFTGVITSADQLRVLDWPTAACSTGPSRRACPSTRHTYEPR